MARVKWDQIGEHFYETGTDHGVLYLQEGGAYQKGVAWNGLSAVTETPSGSEASDIYADNMKYLSLRSAESFGLTLECYTYPDEWMECDGFIEATPGVVIGQQKRKTFGLCYRTLVGNDTEGDRAGYKLHLVYGCSSTTSERSYATKSESPEPVAFSYEITTTPVSLEGYDPTSMLTIDTRSADEAKLRALEDILYGTDGDTDPTEPRLPLPEEVLSIFAA